MLKSDAYSNEREIRRLEVSTLRVVIDARFPCIRKRRSPHSGAAVDTFDRNFA